MAETNLMLNVVVSYWNSTSNHNAYRLLQRFGELYLIEILHQTTTISCVFLFSPRCILLKFYIKPQPCVCLSLVYLSCILLKFYIKPQLFAHPASRTPVVSYWNSTSNHNFAGRSSTMYVVVSYWNSTSNHNTLLRMKQVRHVVSYWNSTSNHNSKSWL